MRMFDAFVAAAFGAALISIHAAPAGVRSAPIDSVNAVLGDASFVAAFGRPPGPADSDEVRIRTHLAYVERHLRAVDVSGWEDSARARRAENLDRLRVYAEAGVFPAGDSPAGRLPTFIDGSGRRCAVAHLVEASAGSALAIAVAGRFRNAYIAAIDDPAFDAWIATSGLSRAELAMIQPAYNWGSERITSALEWRLGAQTLYALTESATNSARTIAAAEGGLRWVNFPNRFLTGKWMFAADGAAGASFSGDAYYRLVFRGGMVFSPFLFRGSALGVDVGAGGERLGDAVPSASIVPFEVYWNLDPPGPREAGSRGGRLQVRGEGQLVLAGRAHEFTWGAYLEALWLFQREFPSLHGVTLGAGLRELGGVRYAVLALGFNAREVFRTKVDYEETARLPWGWGTLP